MRRPFLIAVLCSLFILACDSEKDAAKETQNNATNNTTGQTAEVAAPVEEFDDTTLPFRATGPVARVNGQEVGSEVFNEAARRFGKMAKYLDRRAVSQYRERIMKQLIRDELTDQQLEASDVSVEESEVEKKFSSYLEENFHTEDDVREYYRRTGMSPELIKSEIRKSLALEKYLDQKFGTAVTDDEVRAYYEENQSRFQAPEQVQASHILLRVNRGAPDEEIKERKKDALKLARAARKKGADFAAMAREKSEGPRADKGGELGWFSRKEMVPEFSNAAFRLEAGEVSDPVRSSHGFHVIKVHDKRPERIKPYEEAAPEIRESLERARKRDATVKFMRELRESAEIERLEKNIAENPDFESKPPKFGGNIAAGLKKPGLDGETNAGESGDDEEATPEEE